MASCKALRECVLRLAGIARLRKNDRRTYGKVTGVIWLQTSCQPVGIFAQTILAWNWPLVALQLYCPFSVARGGRREESAKLSILRKRWSAGPETIP
jgi:hypothetical protein